MKGKVTISQIAAALDITPSTVSRALSGSERVKSTTRELIEKTARELGYERNEIAANLRRGTAQTVGIIVPRINRQFFGNVISGAESVLNEAGYTVIISQTHATLKGEIAALKTMKRNQVAGILISHNTESANGRHIKEIIGDDIRLVQFDSVYEELEGAKIENDNFEGAALASRHLKGQGYKHIGTLAGYMSCRHYKERLKGWEAECPDRELVFENSVLRETGREAALKAIERGCDALYCAGDFSALGALDAAREKGLKVPEDFGIVGTANENFTALMSPSLSTIEQSPKEMGRQAAKAFLEGTEGTIRIKMQLIIRESSTKNK